MSHSAVVNKNVSMYLFVIGLFLLLISGTFLSEGMTHIGLDNAVVAKKMSNGFEDFWISDQNVSEHPSRQNYLPLGYWIESRWFILFGENSFLVEKCYSLFVFCLSIFLMIAIWRVLGNSWSTGWIPFFCFIVMPLSTWSATSNILEMTMVVFVLLASLSLLRSSSMRSPVLSAPWWKRLAYVVVAALLMEMAFMVKGVTGLFPLFLPLIYWAFNRNESIGFPLLSLATILCVWGGTLLILILFSYPVYEHLYNYLHHQLIGGLLHVKTVASRFYILYVLTLQLLIPLALLLIVGLLRLKERSLLHVVCYRRYAQTLSPIQIERSRKAWMSVVLGLVGVLPIVLGHKQQDFYIVPTLPFFAIAIGLFLFNMIDDWRELKSHLFAIVLVILSLIVFVGGLLANLGSIHRIHSDRDIIYDLRCILPQLDDNEIVAASEDIIQSEAINDYFYRYKGIQLVSAYLMTDSVRPIHIIDSKTSPTIASSLLSDYIHQDIPTHQFTLYSLPDSI